MFEMDSMSANNQLYKLMVFTAERISSKSVEWHKPATEQANKPIEDINFEVITVYICT